MEMQRLIHLLIILVFLVSCKAENQNFNSEDSIEDSSIDTKNTFSVITKFDTIFVSQAPKRITRNIKLDKEGRLLIAAYDDIVRYDGSSFTHLDKEEGLDSWYAFDVLEDRKRNIWIASDQSGAFRIDAKTGVITNFNTKDGLGHRRNMCVYEDKAGNIWIGGQGGLSKYDGIEFTNFTKEDGLPNNDINTILEDRTGNIWFGTRGNAGFYDGSNFSEIKNEEGKAFFNVWSIIEDMSNNIWLVDSSGLWKYSDGTFTHELPDVWKIYEDTKSDLWFTGMLKGGGSTLKRIKTNSMIDKELVDTEIFKSEKMFFGIVEDENGTLWIGGGDGIWLYNGETVNYYTGILPDLK
jgi:ligand-binding sensor domain-containing protein